MTDAAGPHGPARTSALIVVPILTANGKSIDVQRRREEAAGLAEAIDLHVRRIDETRLTRVRPSTLFGTGKTDKIKSTSTMYTCTSTCAWRMVNFITCEAKFFQQ